MKGAIYLLCISLLFGCITQDKSQPNTDLLNSFDASTSKEEPNFDLNNSLTKPPKPLPPEEPAESIEKPEVLETEETKSKQPKLQSTESKKLESNSNFISKRFLGSEYYSDQEFYIKIGKGYTIDSGESVITLELYDLNRNLVDFDEFKVNDTESLFRDKNNNKYLKQSSFIIREILKKVENGTDVFVVKLI